MRGDAEDEEAVNTLEELRWQLKDRDYVLGNEQREYQMAQAEALMRRFPTGEN